MPTLVASDALADLGGTIGRPRPVPEGVWQSVTLGGDAVYAIPQDTGPMMFYYREDIFSDLGLTVPTTWQEYAETARASTPPTRRSSSARSRPMTPDGSPACRSRREAEWWSIDAKPGASASTRSPRAGRRVLGRPRRGGRHRQQAHVHPSGTPASMARRPDGSALSGAGRAERQPPTPPASEGRAAAHVGRRGFERQLGRLVDGGHHAVEARRGCDRVRDLAEQRPRRCRALVDHIGYLPGGDGCRGIRPHRGARVLQQPADFTRSPPRPPPRSRRSSTART
ncbi:extracellular solute-binding protein [Agromyces flavus]|uniref:extracellular solute-binding protein n=1 Tax=Agromyces flavus TaxID=589382 RepID=UPI0036217628